ncbi:GtrA family protein [Streptomyces sp. M19]
MAFGTVGAVSAVVDVGGSNALHFGVGLGPLTAKTLSTVAATLVAYAGNRLWTFRRREHGTVVRRYLVFFALNAVGMAIALLCLGFTRYGLGLTGPVAYNISANVVGIGLGTVFRYRSYRRWVFPSTGRHRHRRHRRRPRRVFPRRRPLTRHRPRSAHPSRIPRLSGSSLPRP